MHFLQRLLDGILCLKDGVQLLERAAPRFDEEKIDPRRLDNIPYGVDNVHSPTNILQPNRCTVSVDELGNIECKIIEAHTLGTCVGV